MAAVRNTEVKTVILYNRRRIRPETLKAIADAKDGEMIPCTPEELDSFDAVTIFTRSAQEAAVPPKPKGGAS
jgi:hypothetical protein